ncbi:MAG: flavin-binding protein dodecin [Acidimicrobiales bacterium]|jgi:flavin-binding protein dodecin
MADIHPSQVDKVIRVVATSELSWELAAQAAVDEAAKTVSDLRTATVLEADLVVRDGKVHRYRVKLEMAFQLDRSRQLGDLGTSLRVRRHLIIANQTLASPALLELVAERASIGPAEFHVLVPESSIPSAVPLEEALLEPRLVEKAAMDRLLALKEAEDRLDSFRLEFRHLDPPITGEVGLGDPMAAARRVMDRSSFDEVIVSTLPLGASRWLKMDLPSRLERAFGLPVVALMPPESEEG